MMYLYRLLFLFPPLFIVGCSGGSDGASSASGTGAINTTAIETCFDVEITNAGNRETKNICSTLENGTVSDTFNKLGVSRFVRFNVSANANVSIRATRTSGLNPSDPDIYLYRNGELITFGTSLDSNIEGISRVLSSASYVVMVHEFKYFNPELNPNAKTQLNKFVSQKNTGEAQVQPKTSPSNCATGNDSTVSGVVEFERVNHLGNSLDYGNITQEPIQQALVEVICNGGAYSSMSSLADGSYSLNFPNGQNSFIRVNAQMLNTNVWDFTVVNNTTSGQPIYVMDGGVFNQLTNNTVNLLAESGWGGFNYSNSRTAAPFAILDSIRKAKDIITAAQPGATFTTLKINWNTTSLDGTFYDSNKKEITLSGVENSDTDEYDEHVIIHEFGHYYEDTFSRSDSIGGNHSLSNILDIRVAFGEGFGNAFSAMMTGNPVYTDTNGFRQGSGFNFNLENNICTNEGWFNECSVQSILYDIFDSNNESGDSLSSGFAPIHAVLAGAQKNTPAFTSIFSFINALKNQNPGDASAIDALTNIQSIDSVSDEYGSSQITENPGVTDELPVYEAF